MGSDILAYVTVAIGGASVVLGLVPVGLARRTVRLAVATQREERLRRELDALSLAGSGLALLEKFEPQVRSGQTQQVYHGPRAQVIQAMASLPRVQFPATTALLRDQSYSRISELLPASVEEISRAIDRVNATLNGG
jgi:hypothetical protein